MANEYVTSASLKATLALSGQTFADADVALAVEAASREIDAFCSRRFYPDPDANQVRYFTPRSGNLVQIDDLITLTAVAFDSSGNGTFSDTATVNTDFVLEPLNGAADGVPFSMMKRHPSSSLSFPCQYPRSVRVTGKFGWLVAPPAIVEAATILAARLLRRAREAPFGVITAGLDGTAVRITVDRDVAGLIQRYRRVVVP